MITYQKLTLNFINIQKCLFYMMQAEKRIYETLQVLVTKILYTIVIIMKWIPLNKCENVIIFRGNYRLNVNDVLTCVFVAIYNIPASLCSCKEDFSAFMSVWSSVTFVGVVDKSYHCNRNRLKGINCAIIKTFLLHNNYNCLS